MPVDALGWELTVTRGPDSLWVKVHSPGEFSSEAAPLADQLWVVLERHFTYRLVLDLSEIETLDRRLLGQLLALQRRVRHRRGLMRLCGLSASNQQVLQAAGLGDRFPSYCDVEEAVMGSWPRHPR